MSNPTVTIVGTGYVGLGYAVGFTMKGIKVVCIDLNEKIVNTINKGKSPIDEPGMANNIKNAVDKDLLKASTDINAGWNESEAIFICVGTYCDNEGNIDLSQIKSASSSIGNALIKDNKYRVVCVKSTVIPGTTDGVVAPLLEKISNKKVGLDFGLCMSPEFLREGNALEDITKPDKIVIGGIDQKSIDHLKFYFKDFEIANNHEILETDLRTAEMIKYAQNSFLAVKISFINEMANLSERFGVNVGDIAQAMGMDKRISPMFLNAGPGFGGSCFPKDVLALFSAAKKSNYEAKILKAILEVNKQQKHHVIELVESLTSVEGKAIAILGLAFKANTGDTREAVSHLVIEKLLSRNVSKIAAYDPSSFARDEIREKYGGAIEYCDNIVKCLKNADIALILTEWDVIRNLKPQIFRENMNPNPIVVDTRRLYNKADFEAEEIRIKILGQSSNKNFVPD